MPRPKILAVILGFLLAVVAAELGWMVLIKKNIRLLKNKEQTAADLLVKSERSEEKVLTAKAVSWDDKKLVLVLTWNDKDETEFSLRINFLKTFVMIPGDNGLEKPLINRQAPDFKTSFCQGDRIELTISKQAEGKKVAEIKNEDINYIRNLGPRTCR